MQGNIRRNIGRNIKHLRLQNNLTQLQMAELLFVSDKVVSKWENNVSLPDVLLLPKIAALFGVSIETLFSDNLK